MRALNVRSHFLSPALLIALLAVLVGCLDPTEYVYSDPGGGYTLSTVNGAPVPTLLSTGDSLLSGEFHMANMTAIFTEKLNYRRGAGSAFSVGGEGTYKQDGTSLVFYTTGGLAFATGSYDNDKVTVVSDRTYVFLRN